MATFGYTKAWKAVKLIINKLLTATWSHFSQGKNIILNVPKLLYLTFFCRIQRLLELKIIPIVVFDNINASSSAHESVGRNWVKTCIWKLTSKFQKDQNEFVPRKRRSFGDSPFTNLVDHVYKTNVCFFLNIITCKLEKNSRLFSQNLG